MEEAKTPRVADQGKKPVIHRVCEACNNMFTTHPGEPERRCPNCRKE